MVEHAIECQRLCYIKDDKVLNVGYKYKTIKKIKFNILFVLYGNSVLPLWWQRDIERNQL